MLKRALSVALLAIASRVAAAPAPPPHATSKREAPRAIREPVRLTVGSSSELMGVLSPDEQTLYFVSDASGTMDVMVQHPVQSGPIVLSSGLGDAIWPQVSPDGKQIAYISFENDSTGDVCVRSIEEHALGRESCLAQPDSAELQVLWWDSASLAVLSRRGLHGDFSLERMSVDRKTVSAIVARNMIGIAISPDHRWLAYIPVERATADVGVTFSQRTGIGIALQRLGDTSAPITYLPHLPGATGSVAFSEHGDFLEFAQFLNDTNRDGAIDGDDNAIIFRVPFRSQGSPPIAATDEAEQLTSARWDCHYPAPSKSQLIASCSHEGSLDVYSLPLDGAVPREWDDARLVGEIKSARDLWTRLLLSARRVDLATTAAAKEAIVIQTLSWHLELGEYESTIYDAEHRLASPDARSWGNLIAEIARHRRADLALIRGETSEQYIQSERARADALRADKSEVAPRIAQLRTLVISEIDGDIDEKAAALSTFREVDLNKLADPLLAPIVAARAERLFRLRADRPDLLAVYKTLSALPLLDVSQRLEYAQRFVDELARGRSHDARAEAIHSYRAQVDDDSELALLLDVETALLPLDDKTQEDVRKTIFSLYTKNKEVDRRRALVLATLRAAAEIGNEYLQYQFVTSWASSLSRDQPERKYGEELYDHIVLDRAYGEGRQGKIGESRGYFYGATVATDSLEAHIGFIEARLAEGGPDAEKAIDQVYEKRFAQDRDNPIYAFVRAYRLARELPRDPDDAHHEDAVSHIIADLAGAAEALPRQPQIHQVWGFALHERARRTGSRQAAVDANRQYLLALDLARGDERLSAALLSRLGILQASMGNHGLALRYLQQRDEYPHVRALEELGLRIAIAQCAWHSGDANLARDSMLAAQKLMAAKPELARFKPLVSDRLALALTATGDAASARAQYQTLEQLLDADRESTPLNHLKAQVGLAANALQNGEAKIALPALAEADRILADNKQLEPTPKVVWRRSLIDDYRYTPLQYRVMVAGLRAGALVRLGDDRAALTATEQRAKLLEERLDQSEADEDRLELAQTYVHLAALHYHQKDMASATSDIERGLALSDAYNQSTGSETNDAELALIQGYAELRLYGHVPASALKRDLVGELRRVYSVLCKYRNPRLFKQRFLFKTYLTELSLKPNH